MAGIQRMPRADGVATRGRILEAAGACIAAGGFARMTSKEVAAKAGVHLASINHHFGSRAGLYQAVLAEAHRRLVDAEHLRRLAAGTQPAAGKLKDLIRLLVQGGGSAQRWPLTVLAREIMSPSPHLLALQQEEVMPKLHLVLPILAELTGLPPDDPRLWQCLPCIAAPCAFLALAAQMDTPLTNRFGGGTAEEGVERLFSFVMGGLAAIRRENGAEG